MDPNVLERLQQRGYSMGITIDYTYQRLDKHPLFKDRPYNCVILQNGLPILRFRAKDLDEAREYAEKMIQKGKT